MFLSLTSVQADLNDKKSLSSAFKGAYGAFSVTNFWETGKADVEEAQGKNVADAAKVSLHASMLQQRLNDVHNQENNLQHLVWSSLPNVTKRKPNYLLIYSNMIR